MTLKLYHIPLQPQSVNAMNTHRVTKDGKVCVGQTREWRTFKKYAPDYLRDMPRYDGFVNIYCYWVPDNGRLSDGDNRLKQTIDAIVDAGVIIDDRFVVRARITKMKPNKEKHGVYICIEPTNEPPSVDELLTAMSLYY